MQKYHRAARAFIALLSRHISSSRSSSSSSSSGSSSFACGGGVGVGGNNYSMEHNCIVNLQLE